MSGIGHNNGPTMEPGHTWRKHAWTKARRDLIPNTIPIEILRRRVRRAKELGLPYKKYASIRAATGRDVVGFLFSNNALRFLSPSDRIPEMRVRKLIEIKARRMALVHGAVSPQSLLRVAEAQSVALDAVAKAPGWTAAWSDITEQVLAPIRQEGLPADAVIVIGDTVFEAEWSEAGKCAGFVNSTEYFTPELI